MRPDRQPEEALWGGWPFEASWALPQYQHGLEEQGAGVHWNQGPCRRTSLQLFRGILTPRAHSTSGLGGTDTPDFDMPLFCLFLFPILPGRSHCWSNKGVTVSVHGAEAQGEHLVLCP